MFLPILSSDLTLIDHCMSYTRFIHKINLNLNNNKEKNYKACPESINCQKVSSSFIAKRTRTRYSRDFTVP